MSLILRTPWTRQPQTAVGVDWSNPLTRGLAFLANASFGPVELVNRRSLIVESSPEMVPTKSGIGLSSAAAGSSYQGWRVPFATGMTAYDASAPPITLFGVGRAFANLNAGAGFVARAKGSGTPVYALGGWTGSDHGAYGAMLLSGGALTFAPSGTLFDPTQEFAAVLSIGTATSTLYAMQDAQLVDERSASTPSGTFALQYNDKYRCLSFGGSYIGRAIPALGGAVYGRAWSRDEALQFLRNPWQLFEPRRIWVPVSAAGGGTAAITAAAGAATASQLTGSSTAESAITSAAGAATASALVGKATSVAAISSATGSATASQLTGSSTARASFGTGAGSATASQLPGTSTARADFGAAAGAATGETLVGSSGSSAITVAACVATAAALVGKSTARADFGVAAGAATASEMAGTTGSYAIDPASGMASAAVLAGSSIAVASFTPAAGVATAATMAGPSSTTVYFWRRTA